MKSTFRWYLNINHKHIIIYKDYLLLINIRTVRRNMNTDMDSYFFSYSIKYDCVKKLYLILAHFGNPICSKKVCFPFDKKQNPTDVKSTSARDPIKLPLQPLDTILP